MKLEVKPSRGRYFTNQDVLDLLFKTNQIWQEIPILVLCIAIPILHFWL
jgi:hypothetical protein